MLRHYLPFALAFAAVTFTTPVIVVAQQTAPAIAAAKIDAKSKVTAVTLYRGRASVMRSTTIDLEPGVYEVNFDALPEAVQPQSLQARTRGAVNLLSVDYAQRQTTTPSAAFAELDEQIETLQREVKEINQQRELIAVQEQFIDAMSARTAGEAARGAGTVQVDLDAMRQQLEFIAEERGKLLASRRELDAQQREVEKQLRAAQANRDAQAGASTVDRVAVVSIVASEAGPATIELTYLVANATWEPVYNIRAMPHGSSAQVEYEAMLTQRTGEDWQNVALTLSTAQPTIAANPPVLQPWFIETQQMVNDRRGNGRLSAAPASEGLEPVASPARVPPPPSPMTKSELESLAADATVTGDGPAVSFVLPRTVTIETNSRKQQRTRIATINTNPKFTHVAVPMHTEAVYIRGDLTNTSGYQLLPGRASIFVGQDYVGPTTLSAVAPGGEFDLHFGIDPSVTATRKLITKKTENTGLLSGGRRTSYDFRITIDNGSGAAIKLELWDRYPISRTEEIQIETVDMSHTLANNATYLAEQLPLGLLRWDLNLPATATGKSALVVSYGTRINRAKDVQMTPLPE